MENVYSLHYQQHKLATLITPFIFLLFSAKYLSFFHTQLYVLCEHFNKGFQKQKHIFFQTETSLLDIWSRNSALNNNTLNFLGMFFCFYVAKSCHNYSSLEAPHFSLQRNFFFYGFSLQVNINVWNYFRENWITARQNSCPQFFSFIDAVIFCRMWDWKQPGCFPDIYTKWLNSMYLY